MGQVCGRVAVLPWMHKCEQFPDMYAYKLHEAFGLVS